jgi:hypothetical protein
MSRIRTPVRKLRLGTVAPPAQGWIGGDITSYRATSPPRRRIFRRSADSAGLSRVTLWAYPEGG